MNQSLQESFESNPVISLGSRIERIGQSAIACAAGGAGLGGAAGEVIFNSKGVLPAAIGAGTCALLAIRFGVRREFGRYPGQQG